MPHDFRKQIRAGAVSGPTAGYWNMACPFSGLAARRLKRCLTQRVCLLQGMRRPGHTLVTDIPNVSLALL